MIAQDSLVERIVAEHCLIAFKTQAPQPIPEGNDGAQSPSLSPRSHGEQADIEMIFGTACDRQPRPRYCLRTLVSRLTGCGGGGSRRLGEVRIVKRPGGGTGSPGCHRTMDPGIDAIAPVEPAGPCAAAVSTKPNAKTR